MESNDGCRQLRLLALDPRSRDEGIEASNQEILDSFRSPSLRQLAAGILRGRTGRFKKSSQRIEQSAVLSRLSTGTVQSIAAKEPPRGFMSRSGQQTISEQEVSDSRQANTGATHGINGGNSEPSYRLTDTQKSYFRRAEKEHRQLMKSWFRSPRSAPSSTVREQAVADFRELSRLRVLIGTS